MNIEGETIKVDDLVLTVKHVTKKCYIADCSVCGLVTPTIRQEGMTTLDQWFRYHIAANAATHKTNQALEETK